MYLRSQSHEAVNLGFKYRRSDSWARDSASSSQVSTHRWIRLTVYLASTFPLKGFRNSNLDGREIKGSILKNVLLSIDVYLGLLSIFLLEIIEAAPPHPLATSQSSPHSCCWLYEGKRVQKVGLGCQEFKGSSTRARLELAGAWNLGVAFTTLPHFPPLPSFLPQM